MPLTLPGGPSAVDPMLSPLAELTTLPPPAQLLFHRQFNAYQRTA